MRGPNINRVLPPAVLLFSAFLVYSNTFSAPFVFDDIKYIVENPAIADLRGFAGMGGTRYVTFLSFALNFAAGGLNPFGYHLVNFLIHAANAFFVFTLVRLVFKAPVMSGAEDGGGFAGGEGERTAWGIGLSAALLFVAHPVQTQAVTYVSQRFASLAAFFYLFSLCLYLKARLTMESDLTQGRRSRAVWVIYCAAFVMGAVAQKTKEISFTLPAAVVLFELALFNGKKSAGKRLLYVLPFLFLFIIIPYELFWAGHGTADVAGKTMYQQVTDIRTVPRYDYLITQARVVVTYLRLLVLPINQNLDYDYRLFHSALDPEVALSIVMVVSVLASGAVLFIYSRVRRQALPLLVSLGVIWFFVAISVESSVVPITDVIFEHRLYLPSAGAAIAFASAVYIASIKAFGRGRTSLLVVLFVIMGLTMVLATAAYKRNGVWADDVTLWQDTVRKSPGKARPYNNLGKALVKRGKITEAAENFKRALEINPASYVANENMGSALLKLQRPAEAEVYFRKAVDLDPASAEALNSIGVVLTRLGRHAEGRAWSERALAAYPGYADAHTNLGIILAMEGNIAAAIEHLRAAAGLRPGDPDVHYNLAVAYARSGMLDEAITEFGVVLRLKPDDASVLKDLEEARMLKKRIEREGGRRGPQR